MSIRALSSACRPARPGIATLGLGVLLTLSACGDGAGHSGENDDGTDVEDVDNHDEEDQSDADDQTVVDDPSTEDDDCEETEDGVDLSINGIDEDCDGVDGPDEDGDGLVAVDAGGTDCDDADPASTIIDDDADCDGTETAADCDDTDPASTVTAEDADCDGLTTAEDCDDTNPDLGDVDDPECDGVPTHAGGGDLQMVAATEFDMGCTDEQPACFDNEFEIMPVTLTHDYFLGETEVTQAEYAAMMDTNPAFFDECGEDCPVERISWHMAAAYTNALSAAADLESCYTCAGEGNTVSCEPARSPYACTGYRLPTEAEWENAARCDTDSIYAGSDNVEEVGWYVQTSDLTTQPVAQLAANACGFYDLSGNVLEWTQDWYAADYYTTDGRVDPVGAEAGDGKSVRGGGWQFSSGGLRVSYRNTIWEDYRVNYLGFRVARTKH